MILQPGVRLLDAEVAGSPRGATLGRLLNEAQEPPFQGETVSMVTAHHAKTMLLFTVALCLSACGSGSGSSSALNSASTSGGTPGPPAPSPSPTSTPIPTRQSMRFISPRSVPLANCDRVLAADLDRDGKVDFAALGLGGLNVAYGKGNEEFTDLRTYSLGGSLASLEVADFNKDGLPDLAVVDSDGENVKILLGAAARSFSPGPTVASGRNPSDIVVGDWNEDGKLDFATPRSFQQLAVTLRLGDGTGNFTTVPDLAGALFAKQIGTGDFNRDGHADLVVDQNFSVRFYYGNGQAGFSLGPMVSTQSQVDDIEVGDLNNDGHSDVLTNTGAVINDRQGGFTFRPAPFGPRVALSDQNKDGNLDVATTLTSPSPRRLAIFTGDGTGGFQNVSEAEVGSFPLDVVTADFDKDSIPDFLLPTADSVALASGTLAAGLLLPTRITVQSGPNSLELGDVTGDAHPDLLVVSNSSLRVLSGGPGGQFTQTFTQPLTGARIRLVDLNGDGNLDALTPGQFCLNQNRQAFSAPVTLPVGSQPRDIQIFDFVGDSNPDLVVANFASDNVSLLQGNGNAGFALTGTLTGFFRPTAVAITHLNSDNFPDLVVSDFQNLHRLLGSAAGFVPQTPMAFPSSSASQSLAVADLNKDGFIDVIAGNNGNGFNGFLGIYLGDGTGLLAAPRVINSLTPVQSIKVADLDDDGNLDLVTAGGNHRSTSCYLGDGTGNFTRPSDLVAGGLSHTPFDAIIQDLNGDSLLDILTADGNRASVSIFYRR